MKVIQSRNMDHTDIYGETAWDWYGSPVEEKSVWMLYHSHHIYRASLQNETLKKNKKTYKPILWSNSI